MPVPGSTNIFGKPCLYQYYAIFNSRQLVRSTFLFTGTSNIICYFIFMSVANTSMFGIYVVYVSPKNSSSFLFLFFLLLATASWKYISASTLLSYVISRVAFSRLREITDVFRFIAKSAFVPPARNFFVGCYILARRVYKYIHIY